VIVLMERGECEGCVGVSREPHASIYSCILSQFTVIVCIVESLIGSSSLWIHSSSRSVFWNELELEMRVG
jgi:hypothetical protein